MSNIILQVKDLNVYSKLKNNNLIKDVSFNVEKGQCLGILGESGSGKSITMKAVMGLLGNGFEVSGSIILNGRDLIKESKESVRKMRGKNITMILQNPMVCFDSLYRIEYQIKETLKEHTDWDGKTIYRKSIEILEKMKIKDPEEVLKKYPHQLSGGMLQRIMIGIALSLNPDIIIADEPTTAIDSITKYAVMNEFKSLKQNKTTMIFITHDLSMAAFISDKILVMKDGRVMDSGTVFDIMEHPKDLYTKELIKNKMLLMDRYKKAVEGKIID